MTAACRRDGCGTAFLDTSRNGLRRFCSLRCANQVNVASHRLGYRQAAQAAHAAQTAQAAQRG